MNALAGVADENENSDPQNIPSESCEVVESVKTTTMLPKLTRSRSAKLTSKGSQQLR
jgi:hypothetical protein